MASIADRRQADQAGQAVRADREDRADQGDRPARSGSGGRTAVPVRREVLVLAGSGRTAGGRTAKDRVGPRSAAA
ncbi:hypothetical protein DZF91_21675 [Actinomadura logoneensis]|uniref:Uncharacterized protein n=1 Tax=Actinomadura logoneensis TaxID=2293572 RepID=A0A372JHU0_9ACTN|nr:hypothetical protein DZF91_21675 [Actinomadura logoneensis]